MSVLRFASAEVGAHHDIEGEDFHTSFVGPAPAGQSRGLAQYEVGNVDDPEKGLFFTLYVNVPRDERHQLYIVKVYSAIFLAAFRRLLDEESGAASYSVGPLIRKFPKFPKFPGGRQALPRPLRVVRMRFIFARSALLLCLLMTGPACAVLRIFVAGITEFRSFNEVIKRNMLFKPVAFKPHRDLQINKKYTHDMKPYTVALFNLLQDDEVKLKNTVFVLKSERRSAPNIITHISQVTKVEQDLSDKVSAGKLKAFVESFGLQDLVNEYENQKVPTLADMPEDLTKVPTGDEEAVTTQV